jgi:hypothetical protein
VGAHYGRGSACQGVKVTSSMSPCCMHRERKHPPVIGRAQESPFLAVGGETLDQHEWRTGVKRWSIAGAKYGTKGSVHVVVMYDGLERVLSDCFLQASWHASSLGDWLHANSACEVYNTHLCLFLADDAGMARSDIAQPVGMQSTIQLSLSLYLETVMGPPPLLSISRIFRSSSSNSALYLQTYTMRWQKIRVAPIRETLYQALSARG